MNFKKASLYFNFSKKQRLAVLALLSIIFSLQLGFYFIEFPTSFQENELDKQNWLSLQSDFDSLKAKKPNQEYKIYPFNPNFISDYKGYKLGMSVQEIDRLLEYRKQNKYLNSAEEFQAVTQVSDSLLEQMAPHFKFPTWITSQKKYSDFSKTDYNKFKKKEKIKQLDINVASQEDLIKIFGVGETISKRILDYRTRLGEFVSMEQMKEVWGLSDEVIDNLKVHFTVVLPNNLKKIDINNASVKELTQFPYFKYSLAKSIVIYRSMNGDFEGIDDLKKVANFPVEKAEIINSYLDFK